MIIPNTVIFYSLRHSAHSMGFALQIAATDIAVVVAKNAPVIINAVILCPSVLTDNLPCYHA